MLLRKLKWNAKTANWELPFGGNFGKKSISENSAKICISAL